MAESARLERMRRTFSHLLAARGGSVNFVPIQSRSAVIKNCAVIVVENPCVYEVNSRGFFSISFVILFESIKLVLTLKLVVLQENMLSIRQRKM
jgi:hypothetical protein